VGWPVGIPTGERREMSGVDSADEGGQNELIAESVGKSRQRE
jgi:hypothetical protein